MEWYKTLSVHKKIAVKECFVILCGVKWESMGRLFTMRERIEIFYNKLKLEGFDV